jgi:hypothetical protein
MLVTNFDNGAYFIGGSGISDGVGWGGGEVAFGLAMQVAI